MMIATGAGMIVLSVTSIVATTFVFWATCHLEPN